MAKKPFLGLSLTLMAIVLAGCISTPIGDSTLEISTDGIDFVPADSKNENLNEVGGETEVFGVENGSETYVNNDEDMNANNVSNDVNNDNDADELDTEMMGQGGPGEVMCDEPEDHTAFTEHFDYDYYIPECAILYKVKDRASSVRGFFIIENADWGQINEEMVEYFIDVEEKTYEDSGIQEQYANYKLKLSNGGKARVYIEQKETDVYLELRYDYSLEEKE